LFTCELISARQTQHGFVGVSSFGSRSLASLVIGCVQGDVGEGRSRSQVSQKEGDGTLVEVVASIPEIARILFLPAMNL
jgi:hypothetical protein